MHKNGHAGMNGEIVISSASLNGDLGMLFMYNAGWSTMCGYSIIALITGLLDARMRPSTFPDLGCKRLAAKGELRIDAQGTESGHRFILRECLEASLVL